jgi:hypothetical protein
MGSDPATKLTGEPTVLTPSKLILEAPFASADALVNDGTQINIPGSYVTNLELNNADEIKLVQQPFCWLHGLNDNFLGYHTQGEVVYDNYAGVYKEKHPVDGADHGEVPAKMGFTNYTNALLTFITTH